MEREPELGNESTASKNIADQSDEQARRGSTPDLIVSRLKESLPKGTTTQGSFHKGGKVKADGNYALKAGETVNAAPQTDSTQQAAPQTAQPDDSTQTDSNLPDDESSSVGGVNLQRSYSHLNAAVRDMLDGLGIPRSATIPHQTGQTMDQHLSEIGQVMATKGNITGNIMTATHSLHADDNGSTVAHPNQKLLETKIPKDSELAKAAIAACRSLISKCEKLIDETPEIQRAKSQLSLVGKSEGAGMSAFDMSVALLGIPGPVIQSLARLHSEHKHGRIHPALTGPKAQGK